MLFETAILLSVVTIGSLVIYPILGIALLFITKPIVDATWEHIIVAGMPLTQIVAGLVPLIMLGHLCFPKPGQRLSQIPLYQIWTVYTIVLCSSAVAIIYNQDPRSGFSVLLRHANGFIGFYMVQAYFRESWQIQRLLQTLIVAGIVPIGMGLYQLATGVVWRGEEQQVEGIVRNIGLYHDAITIRQYALQTILAGLLYIGLFPPRRLVVTTGLWSYVALATVVLSKAYSKAGLLILVLWAVSWTLLRRRFVTFFVLAGMGAVVGGYLASQYVSQVATIYQKELGFLFGTVGADRTFNGRWYIWQEMFAEWDRLSSVAKLFGSGTVALGAHNDYLQILFHAGIVGLALYLVLLGAVGFMLIRNVWRRTDPLAVAGLMVYLAWMVDTVGLVPSAYSGYQWFVWGLIGLSLRIRQNERRDNRVSESEHAGSALTEPSHTAPHSSPSRRFPLVSG
jgi:O-antigen ligase